MCIQHHAVKINIAEWHCAGQIKSEHNHPRNPLEYEISAGFHDIRRIIRHIFSVGVSQRHKRPLAGGKPRVKGVGIFCPAIARWFFFSHRDFLGAVLGRAKPCRNLNAPHNLPRDIPVNRMFHPVAKNTLVLFGDETIFMFIERLKSKSCERFHFDEPLIFYLRFYHNPRTLADAYRVYICFIHARQKSFLFELLHDFRSCRINFLSREFPGNVFEFAVPVNNLFV